MSTFLITWRPAGELEGSGWPDEDLQKLVERHARTGRAIESWPFSAYRKAREGERVFLVRQGHRGHVLFGYGEVDRIPEPCDGMVDIRFTRLVNPARQVFATKEELESISRASDIWGTRFSGRTLDNSIAEHLERLVVGREPVSIAPDVGPATEVRRQIVSKQNKEARRLLRVIRRVLPTRRILTYKSAAIELGRPGNHARAVAQVCDLLDAATALARVPLLALIAVRDSNNDINPKAWTGKGIPSDLKEQIVERSLRHRFTDADYAGIEVALRELDGLGNHAAWKDVRRRFGGARALHEFLAIWQENGGNDAIDDLGTDEPKRQMVSGSSYVRDPDVRRAVERRAKGHCEFCGKPGFARANGDRYIETHHIIALANDGADRVTNVIALCPNHHREAHFGSRQSQLEKKMIEIVMRRLHEVRT